MTFARFAVTVREDIEAGINKEKASAHRWHNAVLLTINDPDRIEDWSKRWEKYIPKEGTANDAKARAEKKATREWFAHEFNCQPPKMDGDKKEDATAKKDRENALSVFLETVEFCINLYRRDYMSAFTFTPEGGVYIRYAHELGQKIWTDNEWSSDDNLRGRKDKDVQIVARDNQVSPGTIAWKAAKNYVMAGDRAGTGRGGDRVALDMAKPVELLNKATSNMAEKLRAMASDPKQSEAAMIARRQNIINAHSLVTGALNFSGGKELSEKFDALFAEAKKVLGVRTQPRSTVDPNAKPGPVGDKVITLSKPTADVKSA